MTTPNNDPNFMQIKSLYENRLRQFINAQGEYCHLNLPKFYDQYRYSSLIENDLPPDSKLVEMQYAQIPYDEKSPTKPGNRPHWRQVIEADRNGDLKFKPTYNNQPFGPSWTTTWFKVFLTFPDFAKPEEMWVFEFDCENEGLVIDPDTFVPITAFSGKAERNEYRIKVPLSHSKKDPAKMFFYIECANNGMFGCGIGTDINPPNPNKWFHLRKADLVFPNWEARRLYYDFLQCSDAARELPDDAFEKHLCRKICNEVMDTFDPDDSSSIHKCRKIFHDKLLGNVDDASVYDVKNYDDEHVPIYGFGNCHIDTAWLWPFAETRRKVARSWASQIEIINDYPEFQFVASQAQQFKWLKQEHPEFFFDVLLPKVKEGSFIPIGGSWVENDTNMPSGEGLSRQFFFGQRFFMNNFNMKSSIYWLPDTFGYSSSLPQIIKLSQMDYFLTQKLSWNNINKFPYNTFNWQGIDGSEVLCHMPPTDTYTSNASFGESMKTSKNNKSGDVVGGNLLLYGIGDGGGGPTTGMLEKLRRFRGLHNKLGSVIPKMNVGKLSNVESFFSNIERQNSRNVPTWIGELYLEFHRGTYTTQALLKKYMRMSEIQILELEKLATWWSFMDPSYKYPVTKINDIWENILLCQFHDVLPGSCIGMVYEHEAVPMMRDAVLKVNELIDEVVTKAHGHHQIRDSFQRNEVESSNTAIAAEDDTTITLWNDDLVVTVSKHLGVITSIKSDGYEYLDLQTGRNRLGANQFVLFDDTPLSWQAWDTELYNIDTYKYINKVKGIDIVSDNMVEISFEVPGEPNIQLATCILLEKKMIKIKTVVKNWFTGNKFLKVEFPVNVHNDYCSYETQFGITKRPTHFNTTWDIAKFEVCHHKFADYSDFSKGVSIINDCKYGFATHGNLMRLSLLRSPKKPDEYADMGDHEMEYAIFPHSGGLSMETVDRAINFNNKNEYKLAQDTERCLENFATISKYLPGSKPDKNTPLNIVISSVKRGEDDFSESEYSLTEACRGNPRSVVVRVYEPLGGEACGLLTVGLKFKSVDLVDNLELPLITNVPCETHHSLVVKLRPFQIKIFKFHF